MLMAATVAAAGKSEKMLAVLTMFGGIALAAFLTILIRSPRWSRECQGQLDATAEQVVTALSKPYVLVLRIGLAGDQTVICRTIHLRGIHA